MPPFKTATLPTYSQLGVDQAVFDAVNPLAVAQQWFQDFEKAITSKSASQVTSLFATAAPLWRDILCLSWDLRTLSGKESIQSFLTDRLPSAGLSQLRLSDVSVQLQRLAPDLAWVVGDFSFETAAGLGYGAFRLVPWSSSDSPLVWRAYTVFTNLESLKGVPERIGALREKEMFRGSWESKRKQDAEFDSAADGPAVLIVGAGQTGLQVAARLKALGVRALLVEKHARVGDQWRERYDSLSLHSPIWVDYMVYMPYPSTWPVFTPGSKFADWLECYTTLLDLDIWTSSMVTQAIQDPESGQWTVTVERADGPRTLKVNHLVFAHGSNGGPPVMPEYNGMEEYTGSILHSSQYKNSAAYAGKQIAVIGSCTSAHEISADLARNGVDVTMYQRSPTYVMSSKNGLPLALTTYTENGLPIEVADRITASFPWQLTLELSKGLTAAIKSLDSDMLESLCQRGFKTYDGIAGTGFVGLMYTRNGGYYPDTGSCEMIIDGKIKVKSDSSIKKFFKDGLQFADESIILADVVICATGYGDEKLPVEHICGSEVASKLKPFWGFDKEGEFPGLCRPSGVHNLWVHMGTLAMGRLYSKYLALQIAATERGIISIPVEDSL